MEQLHQIGVRLRSASVLLAWLGGLCWLLVSQGYLAFLAPGLWPLLVAGIVVLAGLAGAVFFRPIRADATGVGSARPLRSVFLLLPLAFLVATPLPEAGSYAFDKRAGLTTAGSIAADGAAVEDLVATSEPDAPVRRLTGPAAEVTLTELYADFRTLARSRVAAIGMVNPRPGLPANTVIVFRFTIACCAADAQPVAVLVRSPEVRGIKKDTWVRVEGELVPAAFGGRVLPLIRADRIQKIRRPIDPYLR